MTSLKIKLDYKSSDSVFVNTSPINQAEEQKEGESSDAMHPRSNHPKAGDVYNFPPPNQEDEHTDHASSYVTPPDSNQSIDLMGVTSTIIVV